MCGCRRPGRTSGRVWVKKSIASALGGNRWWAMAGGARCSASWRLRDAAVRQPLRGAQRLRQLVAAHRAHDEAGALRVVPAPLEAQAPLAQELRRLVAVEDLGAARRLGHDQRPDLPLRAVDGADD